MVVAIQVSKSELESLRETCHVLKHNPFGLSIEDYERGVYIVKGTYEALRKVLESCPAHPLKINVILGEEGQVLRYCEICKKSTWQIPQGTDTDDHGTLFEMAICTVCQFMNFFDVKEES